MKSSASKRLKVEEVPPSLKIIDKDSISTDSGEDVDLLNLERKAMGESAGFEESKGEDWG